jgi:hypothetical protein
MRNFKTPLAEISYNDREQLLHVRILEGAEMTLTNAQVHYEKINSLLGNKKHVVLVDAKHYYRIDKEAWIYASKKEIISNRIAVAHYNSCHANKLETSFYKAQLNTAMPVEVFNTKEEAVKWLRSHRNNL